MDSQKQQVLEKLQGANNILVTVSRNPSVDQLSACIALTLLLNKLDKHATAVFSGKIPSTIEFLKPDETIEKNTDSLRDFIIALDKSKADKLRYKVEDKVVKIFITPYRTSLTADDLEFSQGDFNVDVVLALGVHEQSDLDEAITAHGRILHDAVVICVNNTPNGGELGSVNWIGTDASSLSELATELAQGFEGDLLDAQISTALLTGIVAETDRFRNDKTSATTMSISADLMRAGANQQLVADELEHELKLRADAEKPQSLAEQSDNQNETPEKPDNSDEVGQNSPDGTLEIEHESPEKPDDSVEADQPKDSEPETAEQLPAVDQEPQEPESKSEVPVSVDRPEDRPLPESANELPTPGSRSLITQEPSLGGRLTANTTPDDMRLDSAVNPLNQTNDNHQPMLDHDKSEPPFPSARKPFEPTPPVNLPAPVTDGPSAPMPTSQPEPPLPPSLADSKPPEPVATPPISSLPPAPEPPKPAESLTEREEPAENSNKEAQTAEEIEEAREAVLRALNQQPGGNLPPVQALNAQPVDLGKPVDAPTQSQSVPPSPPAAPDPAQPPIQPLPTNAPEPAPFSNSPADKPLDMPLPVGGINLPSPQAAPPTNSPAPAPNSPPPVPPPMMPMPPQK